MKSFNDVLPELIQKFGVRVKRQNVITFCQDRGVKPPSAPATKSAHGIWDFTFEAERAGIKVNDEGGFESISSHVHLTPDGISSDFSVSPFKDLRTDEEIEAQIEKYFMVADMVAENVINGSSTAMILSGAPGVGKTYGLVCMLENAEEENGIEFQKVTGYSRPSGLYKMLYEMREPNQILVLDDIDSIFDDVDGLNILKGALDSTEKRWLSWRSERVMHDSQGNEVPNSFHYQGRVIFVTNIDFEAEINKGHKRSEHLRALQSRCDYVDLNLRTKRELLIRIKSVAKKSDILSDNYGLTDKHRKQILDYLEENQDRVRELSLRTVVKLRAKMLSAMKTAKGNYYEKFKQLADATELRNSQKFI